MIYVADAVMGTGKTESAITYMNRNKHKKFVFITPYLDEARRIVESCPRLNFREPSDKLPEYNFRKYEHTMHLLERGENVSTTHQAFKRYTEETLEHIRKHGYTIIIDENVDVLETFDFHEDDLRLAVDAGRIEELEDEFILKDSGYDGKALAEMFKLLKTRRLLKIKDEQGRKIFYWTLPSELLLAFEDVYILTYMFEGQSLKHFMVMHGMTWKMIGIRRTAEGGFEFCDEIGDVPDYVHNLKNMVEIVDNPRLNAIGNGHYDLSLSWYRRGGRNVERMRRNLANLFNNTWRSVPAGKKLWGSFNDAKVQIKGKGYTNAFLNFNARATNAYRERNHLAYPVNIFMNVSEKQFYESHGIDIDEDAYALSIMVQWIWRSEIRDGEKIRLYIPSKRMRDLLISWIDRVGGGGTENEV